MRRYVMAIVVALVALVWLGVPAAAMAEPSAPGSPSPSADSLPKGFPEDLKKFVGGADEFKNGPWFSGACKDHGGDLGAYIDAALTEEGRLMYWSAPDEQKRAMLAATVAPGTTATQTAPAEIAKFVADGTEPPTQLLPTVFPAGDAAYHLSKSMCADDLKRWAAPEWNTWGFQWAKAPDTQSMTEIRKAANFADVPAKAWTEPCGDGVPGAYCQHAFFVNCEQADAQTGDQQRCIGWNRQVAQLFTGTAQWIDQNTSFSDRLNNVVESSPQFKLGSAYVRAFSWFWGGGLKDAVKFVTDPQSVIDDWANSSKAGAVDLSTKVLKGLTSVGNFDPSQQWFLRWYALSTGLGIAVMGVMTLLSLWRAASKGETMKSIAGDLLGYMPAGVVMMLFAPFLAQLLVELSNALSNSIASVSGPDMGEMVTNLEHFVGGLTAAGDQTGSGTSASPGLPGGAIVGLLLFLLLIAGALGVFFGLMMHSCALPALAVAAGIGFGMWVHPTWRKKALRPVLLFVAVVLSKPLLFLLLAVQTAVINAALTGLPAGQGDIGALGQLCMVVVAFLIMGLAPWSLLKHAPLLPSRADAQSFGNSGSLLAGGIGGIGSSQMFQGRGGGAGGRKDRGGSGSGSGGGGGSSNWRTAGSSNGKGATENRLSNAMGSAARTGSSAGRGGAAGGAGAGRVASGLGKTFGTAGKAAGSAVAAAIPIAAQMSSHALNKARAAAESAPGEVEGQ